MLKMISLRAYLIIFIEQKKYLSGIIHKCPYRQSESSPLLMEWRYPKSKGAVFLLVTKELTVHISMYHIGLYQFGADTDEFSTF